MSIEIKFTFATLAEAAAFMAQHAAEAPGKPDHAKPSPKPKPEATAPAAPAETPAASPPSAVTAQTAAPASASATPATEPVTYEKSGLAQKISTAAAKNKPAVVALLAEFGVAKGPLLKPEQFAEFGEKIDALLLS